MIKVVPVNSRENTGAVLYHDDDADDEEDDDDDHHHHHQTIFKTLLIKVVPVYSREDIREQYCINDKELQVIPIFSYDLR